MRAKKRFGQHFLHDRTVIERIVASLAPQPGQMLVEIGPGHGALTYPVLRRGVDLQAIEIDRELSEALRAPATGGNLQVHNLDALHFDFAALATDTRRLRLFGNLPYNIATELLFRLLRDAENILDMHFMLQKEVAQRLVAVPGSKARGRLSVMIQAWCGVELLFSVPPGAFSPPPAVHSAVVHIVPRERPELGASESDRFTDVVRRAFQQRRKTLRNTLRGCLTESAIREAGVDPGLRAETLSNAQFVKLAEQLNPCQSTGSQS
ncbi:MAG: 16S rRNA (adenine(1518)-N(6)/adenine(1519)-N(6))-dimethyltransferase RsmA [Gammaproteobacteria bacterium]|nr:16S rRNA (adenine(1518)-N(6)/adenine(1519)-N(6))-dimethyltransferase RsmA [Gammaproteobacteria bacterium]